MGGDEERTLTALLRAEDVSIGDAVRIARAVAEQVAALHARGRALGGIGPDSVLVRPDGAVSLAGVPAPRSGLTAPAALRAEDLRGTVLVLAAGLGWPDDALPEPIGRILHRAEEAAAPASALAAALRRLEADAVTIAALLPPPAADEHASGPGALLGRLVPRSDRRTTGIAAAVLAGAAAIGAILLLVGTPGSTGTLPQAAAEAAVAAPIAPATAPATVVGTDERQEPTSVRALLAPVTKAAPAPAASTLRRPQVPAVAIAGPTAPTPTAPTTTPTAVPAATSAPPATAAPSAPAPPESSTPAAPPSVPAPPVTAAPSASTPPAPPVTAAPSSAPPAPASTAAPTPAAG